MYIRVMAWYEIANVLVQNIEDPCSRALLALTTKDTMNHLYEDNIHPVVLHVLFQLQKSQEAEFYITERKAANHTHIRHVYVGQSHSGRIMLWVGDANAIEFSSANLFAYHLNMIADVHQEVIMFHTLHESI